MELLNIDNRGSLETSSISDFKKGQYIISIQNSMKRNHMKTTIILCLNDFFGTYIITGRLIRGGCLMGSRLIGVRLYRTSKVDHFAQIVNCKL